MALFRKGQDTSHYKRRGGNVKQNIQSRERNNISVRGKELCHVFLASSCCSETLEESRKILTLVWRSECDGLCCELLIKVPGVCL